MKNKLQIFCFPYAGGNTTFFDEIEKDLSGYELVKLEYPGHGSRHGEKFADSFDKLVNDLFPQILREYTGGTYALFGYSMGSITLTEILKKILSEKQMSKPLRVFLAAHEPHSSTEADDYTGEQLDQWVKERTLRFGGVPEKLLNNQVFWRMYLPIYRADYSLIGRYRFENLRLKTCVPATVFYSETDTPLMEMQGWKKYFTGEVDFREYEGNHFFIRRHHKEMAEIMDQQLTQLRA